MHEINLSQLFKKIMNINLGSLYNFDFTYLIFLGLIKIILNYKKIIWFNVYSSNFIDYIYIFYVYIYLYIFTILLIIYIYIFEVIISNIFFFSPEMIHNWKKLLLNARLNHSKIITLSNSIRHYNLLFCSFH